MTTRVLHAFGQPGRKLPAQRALLTRSEDTGDPHPAQLLELGHDGQRSRVWVIDHEIDEVKLEVDRVIGAEQHYLAHADAQIVAPVTVTPPIEELVDVDASPVPALEPSTHHRRRHVRDQ